jgi:hypothetical protein
VVLKFPRALLECLGQSLFPTVVIVIPLAVGLYLVLMLSVAWGVLPNWAGAYD